MGSLPEIPVQSSEAEPGLKLRAVDFWGIFAFCPGVTFMPVLGF